MACDFKKRCLRLKTFVWEHEHPSRQIGFQRGFVVVAGEDAVFPAEQGRVELRKLLPARTLATSHAFAGQEEICASDGFVVELRFAAGGGEALQRAGTL